MTNSSLEMLRSTAALIDASVDAVSAVQAGPPAGAGLPAEWALISIVVVGVLLVLLLLGLLLTVLQLRRLAINMREAFQRLEPSVHPVLERARAVGENVEHITRSVRHDVDELTASVEALSGRVQQASDRIEERIEEFNALIEVAQSEAEGLLLDTAATVRGVRAGADALTAGRSTLEEGEPAPAAPVAPEPDVTPEPVADEA